MSSRKRVLEKATRNALKLMNGAGFGISDRLRVAVDPKLSFMGYSTRRNGGDVIVVSGMALKSGMIEGLLIHEMCHIYRTNTHHPSRNQELLNRVGQYVTRKNHLTEDYQIAVVQQAVNHVQDLYADDVAFQVFDRSETFPPDQAFDFFLSWMNDEPAASRNVKAVWLNIGMMLNNCFALSNMIRHRVPDVNNQAENRVQKFLSLATERVREEFAYFKSFMTDLKENVTEKEFEENLTNYLIRITELAS
jgi:hypothetical protein